MSRRFCDRLVRWDRLDGSLVFPVFCDFPPDHEGPCGERQWDALPPETKRATS